MYDLNLPATPTQVAQPASAVGFRDWLNSPNGKAALMQIGVNLLQPIGVGQTFGGHIGQAIAAGGEASARQTQAQAGAQQQALENRQKTRELDIKQQRANTAKKTGLSLSQMLSRQDSQARALRSFLVGQAKAAAEADPTLEALPTQYLSDPEWIAQQTKIFNALTPADGAASTTPAPKAGTGETPQLPPDAAAAAQMYDALPSGAVFIDPNGLRRRKP